MHSRWSPEKHLCIQWSDHLRRRGLLNEYQLACEMKLHRIYLPYRSFQQFRSIFVRLLHCYNCLRFFTSCFRRYTIGNRSRPLKLEHNKKTNRWLQRLTVEVSLHKTLSNHSFKLDHGEHGIAANICYPSPNKKLKIVRRSQEI